LAAAQKLKEQKLSSLLTLLGENISQAAEAEQVTEHYLTALPKIREAGLDGQISVKLTQLGLDLGEKLCFKNLSRLAARAAEFKNWVWIDMEQSSYVERTLALYKKARAQSPNVGVCLQAYLYRTQKDLEELLPLATAIRLVKGAYAEPESIAYPKKKDVDAKYFELSKVLLSNVKTNRAVVGIATHDKVLIRRICQEAEAMGLSRSDFEFQLLYGIQTDEQLRLTREGYRVRTLVSYGSHWFPWYMRRLAERPANLLFAIKHLWRS
jgi:proline dehydrogenase